MKIAALSRLLLPALFLLGAGCDQYLPDAEPEYLRAFQLFPDEVYMYNGGDRTNTPAVPGNKLSQMGTKRFTYDAQGRLSKMEYSNELYLGYEGDKAVRLNFKSGGYLVYTDEGTLSVPSYITYGGYDNLENPSPYADGHIYLPGVKLFRNNPGYREQPSYRELYTYAYGENKLPKERYEKLNTHPHVPALVTSYQYR